ncbi:hypothetical protein P9112_005099 [Eukaryota sp. TZLM1-RC]
MNPIIPPLLLIGFYLLYILTLVIKRYFQKAPYKFNLPNHIAFIMDGNGRWAQRRGFPRIKGHEVGARTLGKIIDHCVKLKVPCVTFYAFSKENWNRPESEVKHLLKSLDYYLKHDRSTVLKENVRFKAIGHMADFAHETQEMLLEAEHETASNTGTLVCIALSYSSREEIADACKRVVQRGQEVSVKSISHELYNHEFSEVDLLIRTSGEQRLSNFLLWQCCYAELIFIKKCWPDFSVEDFNKCLKEYSERNRRFGGVI